MEQPQPGRNRIVYALATVVVIAMGLASRRYPGLLPAQLDKYPGDAFWALMVFCCLGFLLSRLSTLRLAALALTIAYAVELTQLYRAPWLSALRATTLGHLVLGSTFNAMDLVAYAAGVAVGVLFDLAAKNFSRTTTASTAEEPAGQGRRRGFFRRGR